MYLLVGTEESGLVVTTYLLINIVYYTFKLHCSSISIILLKMGLLLALFILNPGVEKKIYELRFEVILIVENRYLIPSCNCSMVSHLSVSCRYQFVLENLHLSYSIDYTIVTANV